MSFFLHVSLGMFHFLRVCRVGRYSFMKRLQNIFDNAYTTFQRVIVFIYLMEIILKYRGCFPEKMMSIHIRHINCLKGVNGQLFNVISTSAKNAANASLSIGLNFAINVNIFSNFNKRFLKTYPYPRTLGWVKCPNKILIN